MIERTLEGTATTGALSTGLSDFDALTGALSAGQLIFGAGRPATGKSAWAEHVVIDVGLRQNLPVLYFTLDFSAAELVTRMVAAEARVEMPLLKRGALEAWHTAAIRAAAERMSQAPLFIDETPSPSIDHIVARCRQQGKDTGLLLIVVDHLHLISLPEGTGAWSRRIAEVCLRLKAIARELGVPSLCLSELNRGPENRSDRRPMMWDLKNADANAAVGNGNAGVSRKSLRETAELAIVVFADRRRFARAEQDPRRTGSHGRKRRPLGVEGVHSRRRGQEPPAPALVGRTGTAG